jgi:hypothetical protein
VESKEPTRSVQRRIAAQKGLPAPDLSVPKEIAELRERMGNLIRATWADGGIGIEETVTKVLSDPSILIKADDQTLPILREQDNLTAEERPAYAHYSAGYSNAQQYMRKQKWVKTVDKEVQ